MIRFLLRWTFRTTIFLVLLVVALVLLQDTILREWLRHRLHRVTGLETSLGTVEAAATRGTLTLRDLRLDNAPEFGGTPLVVIPELHLELDGAALLHRELHFHLARLTVADASLVRNQQGRTNVFALLGNVSDRATAADAAVVSPPGLEFTGIETLVLNVGSVRLVDLAQPANNRVFSVALTNEVLHQVRSAADFNPLILRLLVREIGAHLAPPKPRESPRR